MSDFETRLKDESHAAWLVWTANGLGLDDLGANFDGYSESIVVDEHFVLRVPSNLDLAGAAPLLCAGITT